MENSITPSTLLNKVSPAIEDMFMNISLALIKINTNKCN
jgi:hypothetical protein